MPRLEPGGPGLAVSPDHAWLAVAHGGKLTLIDTNTRETCAERELPSGTQSDVYLSVRAVYVFVRMESATGCYIFALPSLEPITSMELIGHAVPLGGVADRVLVVGLSGEMPRILALVGNNLSADPIPLREPVQFAAEAPESGLLVGARDQIECWDPLRRRALFRLHLPVTQPKLGGFASRRRQLWVVSNSASGPLEVFRFSDGRIQARAELGKRVTAVDGHPESPRLVVAAREGEGKPVELWQFDLGLGERNPIKVEGVPASFAVVDGHKPVLVVGRGDGSVEYVTLPRATPLEVPPKPAAKRESEGSGLSDRLAGWRNRLGEKSDSVAEAARRLADPPKRREESKPVRPVREPMGVPMTRTEPESAVPAVGNPRPIVRREEVPAAAAPEPPPTLGWRGALCTWAVAALRGQAGPLPDHDDTTLATAALRMQLSPAATRGLALLYGQWLLGGGARGVAAATLAQVIDDDDPWEEALLRGRMARLCRLRGGRVRLRALAARFLDGRPPKLQIVRAPADATPAELETSRWVSGECGAERVEELARKLGRSIAVIDSIAGVEAGLTEARLADLLPLVKGDYSVAAWAPLTADEVVLCAGILRPAELAELPTLE
jgi:hypothetical protein